MKRTNHKLHISSLAMLGVAILISISLQNANAHDFARFITQPYYGAAARSRGWSQGSHYGIDFILRWQSVVAAADGEVDQSGWDKPNCHDETQCPTGTKGGLGLRVRIRHNPVNGEVNYTYYGHLSVARPVGQVNRGQWIGTSGDSGNSCEKLLPGTNDCDPAFPHGPHLHFEVTHVCADLSSSCSVNPDNAGGSGTPLWSGGEWSGSNPTQSKATKRYVTLGSYGNITTVDDSPTNTAAFVKGCALASCPDWFSVLNAGYDSDYLWTYDSSDNTEDYWAEWRPSLPSQSNYEVLAWMPCGPGNTANANFTVWSAYYYVQVPNQSLFGPIKVDQLTLSQYDATDFRRGCNRWIGLGVYDFPAGAGSFVRIRDDTDETGNGFDRKVGVDAVKFVRVNIGRFEAEKPFKKVKKTDQSGIQHEWIAYTNGLYGGNYISARQNTGANINTNIETYSPKIRFNVIFPTAGVYHVWIRGYGATNADDSIHAGFLGNVSSTADKIFCSDWNHLNQNGSPNWYWCKSTIDGQPATIDIAEPGTSVFELWMREDGFNVDQIVLTKDPSHDEQAISTNSVPFIFPGDDTSEDDDP